MKKTAFPKIVVIDSDYMKRDRSFSKKDLLYLKELSQLGLIQIHIPWFVYKECTSDNIAIIEEGVVKALSGIRGLERKGLHLDDAKNAENISKDLETLKTGVKDSVEKVWKDYISETKAVLHDFDPHDSVPVFESYFNGAPPFSKLKNREDIPDAFIFQTLKKISKSHKVSLISGDENLRKKCEGEANITTYKTFEDFYASEEFKPIDEKHRETKKFESLSEKVSERIPEIKRSVRSYFENDFVSVEFEDNYLLSDDKMGTVTAIEDVSSVEVLEDEVKYVDENFYVPIQVKTYSLVDSFIYKPEYWMADEERRIHTQDWNEHVFLAEEGLPVKFQLTIRIPKEDLENDDQDLSIEIKDFDEISIDIPKEERSHNRITDL